MGSIRKVAVIGAGNMGGAIAAGMAKGRTISTENISVSAKTEATIGKFREKCPGIAAYTDNRKAADGADLIILAVKPWQLSGVIEEIKPVIDFRKTIVASVVAGVRFSEMETMFGTPGAPLLRIIPNTAISLMKSVTFMASSNVPENLYEEVADIFREMGKVFRVSEEMMPAGTALASCGIAYALRYLGAAMKGGEVIGFTGQEARDIVMGTMDGALSLLETNNTMPQQEIDKVTTPGGFTFKGLEAMENAGFSVSVAEGLKKSM